MALKQAEKDSPLKSHWKKIINSFSHSEDQTNNEPDPATQIRKYIDDLGSDANAGPLTGFVTECYEALRGDGNKELQQQILNTLAWRSEQISLIQTLLKRLQHEGLSSIGRMW